VIVALRQIEPDEEITYDYGRDYLKSFLAEGGCRCAACRKKTSAPEIKWSMRSQPFMTN
jgi:SET domain-containing protein